ncbi:MAG: hypothetical protein ABI432_14995 [Flavobacteriales bacterium]
MRPTRTLSATLTALLFAACTGGEQPAASPVVADSTHVAPVTDGPQIVHTTDGGRMEGDLREAERNGPWTSYFANGGIRSKATYRNGLEEGATEVFHENGMTYYTGQYRSGKPVGEWLFYDPKGVKVKTVRYDSLGVMLDQR